MENNEEINEMNEIINDDDFEEIEDSNHEYDDSKGPNLLVIGLGISAAIGAAGYAVKKRIIDPKIEKLKAKRSEKKEDKKSEKEIEMVEGKDFEAIEDEK